MEFRFDSDVISTLMLTGMLDWVQHNPTRETRIILIELQTAEKTTIPTE